MQKKKVYILNRRLCISADMKTKQNKKKKKKERKKNTTTNNNNNNRSDATERGGWSGSTLFALVTGNTIKHSNNKN